MAERKHLGILLFDGESWAGGFYYVLSAIKALHTLPQQEQPNLTVFYLNESGLSQVKAIGYKNIKFLPVYKLPSLSFRIINKLFRLFTKQNVLAPEPYSKSTVDYIFPYNYLAGYKSLAQLNKIYWIPDFQHLYYPDFFPKDELAQRNKAIQEISRKEDSLVLSSNSAFNDYKKHYPDFKNKIHVIPFVSMLPDISGINWETVKSKFQLPDVFFFCPNQFWRHKNHIVVLKAVHLLKTSSISVNVIFSGKDNDPKDQDYVKYLKDFVVQNNLNENVKFLGFIDRKEQLKIMQNALAVIQPSLFEGWSTVLEDAKALNQFIIASDIDVHKEQLVNNCLFFERAKEKDLAEKVKSFLSTPPERLIIDYVGKIHNYAGLLAAL